MNVQDICECTVYLWIYCLPVNVLYTCQIILYFKPMNALSTYECTVMYTCECTDIPVNVYSIPMTVCNVYLWLYWYTYELTVYLWMSFVFLWMSIVYLWMARWPEAGAAGRLSIRVSPDILLGTGATGQYVQYMHHLRKDIFVQRFILVQLLYF